MITRRLGLIGAGNIAEALLRGLLSGGAISPERCAVTNRANDHRLLRLAHEWGVLTTRDKVELMREGEIIILAVKPTDMPGVLREIAPHAGPHHFVVSVAAAVTLETIESELRGVPAARTMPNTSTAVAASATAVCLGRWAGERHLAEVRQIFEAVGTVTIVPEPLFDVVTGLSGSGPAYVYLMAEALVDAGLAAGMSLEVAQSLTAQTILGAGKMLVETGDEPAVLRRRVTSPGGTTMAGLAALEAAGFQAAIRAAVEQATIKGRELRPTPVRHLDGHQHGADGASGRAGDA